MDHKIEGIDGEEQLDSQSNKESPKQSYMDNIEIIWLREELQQTKSQMNRLIDDVSLLHKNSYEQLTNRINGVLIQLGLLDPVFDLINEYNSSEDKSINSYIISKINNLYIKNIHYELGNLFLVILSNYFRTFE